MMQRIVSVVGLLVAASSVVACAATVEPASQSQSAEINEAERNASAIVWTQAERKATVYVDEEGRIVSHRLGLEIANGADVLRLRTTSSNATLPCTVNWGNGEQNLDGKYEGYGISLASASARPEQVLVPLAPVPSDNEAQSLRQGADITGSVGPYVFVREWHDAMFCGAAHGGRSVKAFVWSIETGSVADLGLVAPESALAKAKEMLAGQGFESEPKLAEIIPRFDGQARLSLAYRFEKEACYACSDRNGNDYSISATVEGPDVGAELPAALAAFAEAPKSVSTYAATGVAVNGWSTVVR